jgi:pyruvate, water dikinase
MTKPKYVRWFAEITYGDVALVGGKNASLAMVAFEFDERDPGVLAILKQAVEGAKRNGRHSGICGQAPWDYLEIAKYLVEIGIDSMSLSPDSVLKTMRTVVELEKELGRQVRQPEAA